MSHTTATPNPSAALGSLTLANTLAQRAFLTACLSAQVLAFGTFTLKSGRASPYFFNAARFHTAALLAPIAAAYAARLHLLFAAGSPFDVVFGPAYKGIPLAVAALAELGRRDPVTFGAVGYAFERKEAKGHGEGGTAVGMELGGRRVVVVDDVITAGTAVRAAVRAIREGGGVLVGVLVAMDRMERVDGLRESAVQVLARELGVPVLSILTLEDVLGELRARGGEAEVGRLEEYRREYGV
ncbi:MAG: orotate phosphoribosyltransferase [Trizodia sp. TS-e1964]|nr:MAG: orotate phosphoribosyltransferase [Trizodia sp. TS-e1964]